MRALSADGANGLLADADLPGVGNVFRRVADDVDARAADGEGHGELVLRLHFAAA